MRLTSYDYGISEAKTILEQLRKEISGLTIVRDKIREEIKNQRTGKTYVHNEKNHIEEQLHELNTIYNETKNTLKQERKEFYDATYTQQQEIDRLSKIIQEKEDQYTQLKEKEKQLIDVDTLNKKYKKQLAEKAQQIEEMNIEIKQMKKEKQEFYKYKKEQEDKIQDQQRRLNAQLVNNKKIEKDLKVLLKREKEKAKKKENIS